MAYRTSSKPARAIAANPGKAGGDSAAAGLLSIAATPPAGPMVAGLLCGAVYLVFAVAAATAAASVARSTLGTISITLGVLLALPVLGLAGPLHPWLPSTLVTAPVALLDGSALNDYLPALAVAATSTVLLLAAATSRFGRREV